MVDLHGASGDAPQTMPYSKNGWVATVATLSAISRTPVVYPWAL